MAGNTIAAISNATPPTVAKLFDAFELVVDAANTLAVEIIVKPKTAIDLNKFVFLMTICLKSYKN